MLSDYLNYSKASVSVAVRGLLADGYVIKDRYGSIELTEEGRKIAEALTAMSEKYGVKITYEESTGDMKIQ